MKKALIAILVVASLVGCKKGENDPFLSFRSRDGRVIGEWKVSGYNYDETTVNGTQTATTKVSFDGSKYTSTNSVANPPVDAGTYEVKLEILKDGKIKYTRTRTEGNITTTVIQEGNWSWADNRRKKSLINIGITGNLSMNNYITGGMYEVDQLKNKEIILTRSTFNSSATNGAAGSSNSTTTSTSLTLTQ